MDDDMSPVEVAGKAAYGKWASRGNNIVKWEDLPNTIRIIWCEVGSDAAIAYIAALTKKDAR